MIFSPPLLLAVALVMQAETAATDPEGALTVEFVAREREWMEALVRHAAPGADTATTGAALEGYLAPEYALVVSSQPTRPIARADWLRSASRYVISEFRQRDLVARRVGDTVVTSLVHWQKAMVGEPPIERSGEFFIVDVWRRVNGRWQVAARYSGKVEEARGSSAGAIVTSPKPAASPRPSN